jgi:energy-coupling factor transporter transmembrane protein EcfT
MILGVVVSFATESSLPAPLRDYLRSQWEADTTASDIVLAVVSIALLITLVVSVIGLYRFWRFARPLTVVVWVVVLIFQAFVGPTVDSGFATSLYELGALLTGMILAVIYITPARRWFEKTHHT